MTPPPSSEKRRPLDFVALLARVAVGRPVHIPRVSKVRHGAEFLGFVRQQLLVTDPSLSSLIATAAPWLEVLYGLLLLTGLARDAAALLARWWLGCVFIFMGLHKPCRTRSISSN